MGYLTMNKAFIVILLVIIPIFTPLQCYAKSTSYTGSTINISGCNIKVEIADTESKRKLGLMGRKSLNTDSGMLFIFDKVEAPVFWMKDCNFPIDIIFLKNNKIVKIYNSVPPCKLDPCELYPAGELVDKALEVQSGFAKKHKVKIGQTVKINLKN